MNMNTTYTSLSAVLILAIVAIAFNACKPESTGELGDPFDKVAGMAGTWELSSFTQQDLNSPVKETRDLSAFYIDGTVTPLQLTFNADRTYSVALEMGKNYFGEAHGASMMTCTPPTSSCFQRTTPWFTTSVAWSANLTNSSPLNTDAIAAERLPTFTPLNSIA